MSTALYETLDALDAGLQALRGMSPEYADKMLHRVPAVPSVDREAWLCARLAGKTILHIGCVGRLHAALLKTCQRAYGIDQEAARYPDFTRLNVETMACPLPQYAGVEVVLLAEILEHLVSPGALLQKVRAGYPECEVMVTVPNAFSEAGRQWMQRGYENVNRDHKMWFSYQTLLCLVQACGFQLVEWSWYGGRALGAEGLLMVVR